MAMTIMLAGDTHGDNDHMNYLFAEAVARDVDLIIVLGDFGFWTHMGSGQTFLKKTAKKIRTTGIAVWWIDGNHENFNNLYEFYPVDDRGFRPMFPKFDYNAAEEYERRSFHSNIHDPFCHIPRGTVWTWETVRFCAFGGAYSIDKGWRVQWEMMHNSPGSRWWPQETITEAELIEFEQSNPPEVDVFLSHDCPEGVDIPTLRMQEKDAFPESRRNREMLKVAVDLVKPDVLYHGHYHEDYIGEYEGPDFTTKVLGLNMNGTGERSWTLLKIGT